MATKKNKKPKPPEAVDEFHEYFKQRMADIQMYTRCRYGSVAPDDRQLPASHAATALRKCYEGPKEAVQWGEILLSIHVAAFRDGFDMAKLDAAIASAVEEWVKLGSVPAAGLTASVPGTHPSLPLE